MRNVIPDLDRKRLAKVTLVSVAIQVQLQRLRLQAERVGGVFDDCDVEVGLAGDRTDGHELVACQLDL